jgi:hypothetical protein
MTVLLNLSFAFQNFVSGLQWLMPVIQTTQEAEVRRIAVRGQP